MHPSRRLCPQTTSASTAARAPAAAIVSSASYLSTWLTILSFVNEPRSVFFSFFSFSFLFTRIERWNISGREGMRGDLADWKKIMVEYFREDFNFLSSKILNRSLNTLVDLLDVLLCFAARVVMVKNCAIERRIERGLKEGR